MKQNVYLVNPKTKPVGAFLAEAGFEVIIGDGKLSDAMLRQCWAMIPAKDYISDAVLEKAPGLKLIVKKGVGLDRIDVDACTKRGVCVANTPFSNYRSVAEHTVALMFACAKQLYPISLAIRCENPDAKCMHRYTPMELYGKTLSIIGLGNIGRCVAQIVSAMGMRLVGYSRHPVDGLPEGMRLAGSVDEAVSVGDFVSIHVTGSEENRNLIDARRLSLMKPGAFLINTTRGFVVDEGALYDALSNKRIAGAGLDVFADEPIRGENPILKLENVIATPHCAGFTPEANARAYSECADLIINFAKGSCPPTAVNKV